MPFAVYVTLTSAARPPVAFAYSRDTSSSTSGGVPACLCLAFDATLAAVALSMAPTAEPAALALPIRLEASDTST